MSDINLDFTVSNNSIDFTVQPNDITITPTDIQLSVYASGAPIARGANMEVQYNNEGLLDGNPAFTFDSDTNLLSIGNINTGDLLATGEVVIGNAITSNVNIYANTLSSIETNLGDVSNITIDGGTNGYVLQTDGAGNLSWTAQTGGGGNGTPGGSNTQIQYNDNGVFGGNTGFTFNEITGNVAIPGNLSVVGNITGNVQTAYLANYATVANSVAVANVLGIGNIATINKDGNASNILYGNGVFASTPIISNVPLANFANYAGNVTVASQPNITSLGLLTNVSVTGNVTASTLISNVATGTAPFVVSSTTVVANLRAATANTANTVTASAQPNITSVGVLGNLLVGGAGEALVVTNIIRASGGNIANIYNTSGIITANRVTANTYINGIFTFATVPSGAFGYQRTMISDANTTTFNAVVGGGGANIIPIFWDGTNWRVG